MRRADPLRGRMVLAWAGVTLALFGSLAAADGLDPQERQGREIYRTGQSPSGEAIEARVGPQDIRLDAASFPCATCHGADGSGRAESGVDPSDIRWSRLSRGYGGQSVSGRRFSAYDEASLARAITAGVDPEGNRLDSAMPRFELSESDLDALVAYLMRLESDRDPGIHEERLTLATVIPASGPRAQEGEAVAAVLAAQFADLNDRGGLYGRQLELLVRRAEDPESAQRAFAGLMDGDEAFALLAPFTEGMDEAVAALAESHGVPVLAPMTHRPPLDAGGRRYSFYLYPGPATQARALMAFALGRLPGPEAGVAVVHAEEAELEPLVEAAVDQAEARGRATPRRVVLGPEGSPPAVEELAEAGIETVLFLGDGPALRRWLEQAAAVEWWPRVYALGGLVGREALAAPSGFQQRLHLAFPSAATGLDPEVRADFADFHRRHGLPRASMASQVAAYAAGTMLTAALRQSGRELSRERLVAALDGFYAFHTGLTPPLTYTGSRRIGARGAYVMAVDLQERRLAGDARWVEAR